MASNNAANVATGKPKANGAIWRAPVGTTLPESSAESLDSGFVNLGFVSEDGLVRSLEVETEEIKAWGGDTVVRAQTSRSEIFRFTLIETNIESLKVVFGDDNVTMGEDDIIVLHNSKELDAAAFVFEIALSSTRAQRIVVPHGSVIATGETTYVDGDAIGYEVEVSALPDASGNTAYSYIAEVVDED